MPSRWRGLRPRPRSISPKASSPAARHRGRAVLLDRRVLDWRGRLRSLGGVFLARGLWRGAVAASGLLAGAGQAVGRQERVRAEPDLVGGERSGAERGVLLRVGGRGLGGHTGSGVLVRRARRNRFRHRTRLRRSGLWRGGARGAGIYPAPLGEVPARAFSTASSLLPPSAVRSHAPRERRSLLAAACLPPPMPSPEASGETRRLRSAHMGPIPAPPISHSFSAPSPYGHPCSDSPCWRSRWPRHLPSRKRPRRSLRTPRASSILRTWR